MNKFSFQNKFSNKKQKTNKVLQNEEQAKEIKSAFIQGIESNAKKFQQETDMEFFICIAFQSREQKEDFLKQKGWDNLSDKYFAGKQIADVEGIKIQFDTNQRKKFKFKPQLNTLNK